MVFIQKWNNLPNCIKSSSTLTWFRKLCKNLLLKSHDKSYINKWIICHGMYNILLIMNAGKLEVSFSWYCFRLICLKQVYVSAYSVRVRVRVLVYLELRCALKVFVYKFPLQYFLVFFLDIDVFDCKWLGPHPQALICFHRGSKPICISL